MKKKEVVLSDDPITDNPLTDRIAALDARENELKLKEINLSERETEAALQTSAATAKQAEYQKKIEAIEACHQDVLQQQADLSIAIEGIEARESNLRKVILGLARDLS